MFINRLFTLTTLGREPRGVLYLSSALKSAGHKVDLVDAGCFGQVFKRIHSFQPDLLAYPIIRTGFHRFYLSLNRKIQQKQRITTIWGGPHPTFFPQMIEGEGEKAFCELADCLQRGGPTDKVDNFWIKKFEYDIFPLEVRWLREFSSKYSSRIGLPFTIILLYYSQIPLRQTEGGPG